jgi:hypothetical protein
MRGGPGMRGGPPPGWNGRGRGGMPPGSPKMGRGGPPPPGYGQDRSYQGGPGSRGQSPAPYGNIPRGVSPAGMRGDAGMIGQAVEMDERSGLPSPTRADGPSE